MGRNDTDRELVEARNVTLYPRHWAMVDSYSKDMGYDTTSAALRRIISEWAQFKQAQLPLPQVQPCR